VTVTKLQLADRVHEACGGEVAEAVKIVEGTLAAIKAALADGEDVLISGFGKFHVRDKEARKGRNPKTGEELEVAPRRVVTYHAAAELRARCKAKVNPEEEEGESTR
jgi:integration host factor subunit alpha